MIMVVDDELALLELLKFSLTTAGYEVITFSEPLLALQHYKKHGADLILLDMTMPGMSGDALFIAIREINPAAKIIIISGYACTDKLQRLMETGGVDFIPKPFTIQTILSKAGKLCSKKLASR